MKVAVDLLFWTGTRGGMETYIRELSQAMGELDTDLEFLGIGSRELVDSSPTWFPGDMIGTGIVGSNRMAWARGEWTVAAAAARRSGADVLHSPANVGPVRSRVPLVTTIHDLLPFSHPEWLPGPYGPVLRTMIRRTAAASRRIVTVSAASRRDIVDILGVPGDRIDVVSPGIRSAPAADAERAPDLLLAIGNVLPHKNHATLLRAMALMPTTIRPRLVVAGGGTDSLARLVAELGLKSHVELAGWVSAERKADLLAEATALALPTRFEGFGLPVLEALAAGCPVICSDLPVLREVAGEAAVYVADEPSSWAAAIAATLQEPGTRRRHAGAGLERSRQFTWARAATEMRGVLLRAAGAS